MERETEICDICGEEFEQDESQADCDVAICDDCWEESEEVG